MKAGAHIPCLLFFPGCDMSVKFVFILPRVPAHRAAQMGEPCMAGGSVPHLTKPEITSQIHAKFCLRFIVWYLVSRYSCDGRSSAPGGACRVVFRIVLPGSHPHDLIGAKVSTIPETQFKTI